MLSCHSLTLIVMPWFKKCLLLVKHWLWLSVTIRSSHDLDSLKYYDKEPSPDELAKWQYLLGEIPNWKIIT